MSFTESADYDIRYTTLDDMVSLMALLKLEGMLKWYPPVDSQEMENFVRIWMGFTRYNACLTATYKGTAIGHACIFLMPYRKVAHHCMFNLIVDPDFSRKGVGTSLVKNLRHLAKTQFRQEMIYAEILGESGLVPLLEKLEFSEFARQERFVKEGDDYSPRILMGSVI